MMSDKKNRMNILYISKLDGAPWSGPSYSIPKQIDSQSLFDNVMWYNLVNDKYGTFSNNKYYCDITKYPSKKIEELPEPFNVPDLIIIEQFYAFTIEKIINEIQSKRIPYIIVPRGELNAVAQKQKRIKKTLANKLIMNKFVKGAIAVQFLTESESVGSDNFSIKSRLVIPNGIDIIYGDKEIEKEKKMIDVVYIGRLDYYHKGLDLMVEAIVKIKETLRERHCRVSLYGPDRSGCVVQINKIIKENDLADVLSVNEGLYGGAKEEVLTNCDVFIMTSRFEGLPMGLIEALSYGIPAIVTDGTNMRREIEINKAGWGCETEISSIADAFVKMMDSLTDMCKYRDNARKLALSYSWNKIADSSHKKYIRLLEEEI